MYKVPIWILNIMHTRSPLEYAYYSIHTFYTYSSTTQVIVPRVLEYAYCMYDVHNINMHTPTTQVVVH